MTTMPCVEAVDWVKPGHGIAAHGHIPADAEFFKDHFPGFPVLPGVLALEILRQTAECYVRNGGAEAAGRHVRLKKISRVKFADYLKPGAAWQSHLELVPGTAPSDTLIWNGRLMHDGRAAVSARLEVQIQREPYPEAVGITLKRENV